MSGSRVNADLLRERQAHPHDPLALTLAIYGEAVFPKLQRLQRLFSRNPKLDLRHTWHCDSQTRYLKACGMAEELAHMIREHKLMDDEALIGALQVMVGEDMFLLLHLTMFMCTLEAMCSEEQGKFWLPLARDFRILGTYAQTELGHGSNVSRLETEAVFDEATDEWVLNTPSLTARKWWVGGLAKSCTHCILMARLKIKRKDYGVHPFILQVRDLQTHRSLPGVSLVHIGKKMGYIGMDNGSLHLSSVRIPRNQLLMRFCSVTADGTYTPRGNKKLLYSTLTFTRKQIILSAGVNLSRSVVVAIRYAAVRRQFAASLDAGAPELQVLSYSTIQRTLMPMLGMAVGFVQAGRWADEVYKQFKKEAAEENLSRLEELHLITSCLKAYMTLAVAEGMEKCRKCCGGHGYMLASGVSLHFVNFVPQATYEGDYVVLSIQSGRLMLKIAGNRVTGKIPDGAFNSSVGFLYTFQPVETAEAPDVSNEELMCPQWLLGAFERRVGMMLSLTASRFAALGGPSVMAAFEAVKVDFTKLTAAHAQLLVLRAFKRQIDKLQQQQQQQQNGAVSTVEIMLGLFRCLSLSWLEENLAEFLVASCISLASHAAVAEALSAACAAARETAVIVADAFRHTDNFLNSALGRYDGNVYEALFESTQLEPLNRTDVSESYEKHLQYILHPERKTPRPKL